MDFQYNNGVFADHYNINRTPLEASIARYESNVDRLVKLTNQHFDRDDNPKMFEAKEKALSFLERERQKLETMGQVYDRLEDYRKEGMKVVEGTAKEKSLAFAVLQQEEHHPTSDLENNMRAEGIPKPSKLHTAHHICPGSGQYLKRDIRRARVYMHTKGVRINDPANGVYLLTKDSYTPHYSMPNSRGHLKYHTKEYETLVAQRIIVSQSHDSIKTTLQVIGRILQQNEPKSAFAEMRAM